MSKARVMVVEDESDVRSLMTLHLEREGHQVIACEDSERALQVLAKEDVDLMILDWMLPGLSGLDLCKRVSGKFPILMVTARADATDIVLGLEMGADDYITKPFQLAVFNARVRALLRRLARDGQDKRPLRFEVGELVLDVESHSVHCQGGPLSLTPSEFKALAALMQNQGRILSRPRLIRLIQGEGITVTERAIDTLIFGLRKNLGNCAQVIETVRGIGYRIRSNE